MREKKKNPFPSWRDDQNLARAICFWSVEDNMGYWVWDGLRKWVAKKSKFLRVKSKNSIKGIKL